MVAVPKAVSEAGSHFPDVAVVFTGLFFHFFAHGIVIDWKGTSRIWCLMINILYVHIGHLSSCWEEMICFWVFNLRVFLMTGSPQHKTTETLLCP